MPPEGKLAAQVSHHAMGTVMTHKAFGNHAEDSLIAVCREIARLEGLLSRFLPTSEISRVNGAAGIGRVNISRETYEVLFKAAEFSQSCPGCFDLTIGPLVTLWQRGKASLVQPDEASIRQILPLVNYRDLNLEPSEMTAGLRRTGQAIDLGGIGKGFAGDSLVELLKEAGITSAYSNLGGNVVTVGARPDGSPWQIGIQHPRQVNRLIGAVSVIGETVVTSGDYQRVFTDRQGKAHHHILDPKTGYPSDSGLISVSVIAEKSLAADALSTILFVAGLEKGLEILKGFPQTEAVFVDAGQRVLMTKGLISRFQADTGIEVTTCS